MRMGKEGVLQPADSFKSARTNKYFTGYVNAYDGGVEDDHLPFLQRS